MVLSIPMPEAGKPLIKSGQKVDFNTPIFEQKIRREMKIFISQKIDVSPQKIFQYIKKLVGDRVEKGELLAEKKSFMGGRHYKSEYEGILKEINHTDGSVVLEVSTQENTIATSFFKGEITKIDGKELHLKVEKAKQFEVKEQTGSFGGKTYIMKKEHDQVSEEDVAGCVIIADSVSSYSQMKLEALGVSGFVILHHLKEKTDSPRALFKHIKEFEESCKHGLPYCFVDAASSTIVFYA